MKKKFLFLFVSLVLFTGCVKYNANMEVKKDKSMDFTIIYALDTSIFGDQSIMSSDELEKIKKSGFVVSDYVDGNMKGYSIKKSIDNIDSVSSSSDVNYSLSGILDDSSDTIFTVKKGFFKNTYTANFKFDAGDSSLGGSNNSDYDDPDFNYDDDYDNSDINYDDSDMVIDDSGLEQFSDSLASNMDLSFNVSLPYAAISNNATNVNDGDKQLSWQLASDSIFSINFEFQLFNFTNILILAGGIVGLIVLVVVLVFVLKRKNSNGGNIENESFQGSDVQVSSDNNIVNNSFIDSSTSNDLNLTQQSENMNVQKLVPELGENIVQSNSVDHENNVVGPVQNNDLIQDNNVVKPVQGNYDIFESPIIDPVSNSQVGNDNIDVENQSNNSQVEKIDETINPFNDN